MQFKFIFVLSLVVFFLGSQGVFAVRLGFGAYAVVDSISTERAKKTSIKSIYDDISLLREYWIMKELGILQPSDFALTEELRSSFEMDRATQVERIAGLPHDQIPWIRDISLLLHRAHQRNIAHLDVKLKHVLLTPSGKYTLIDWGISQRHAHLPIIGECFTEPYRPCENWENMDGIQPNLFLQDLWAVGMTGLEHMNELNLMVKTGEALKSSIKRKKERGIWPTDETHTLYSFLQEDPSKRSYSHANPERTYFERYFAADSYEVGMPVSLREIVFNWLYEVSIDVPLHPVYLLDAFAIHDALSVAGLFTEKQDFQLRAALAYHIAGKLHNVGWSFASDFTDVAKNWFEASGSTFHGKDNEEGWKIYEPAFKEGYVSAIKILGGLERMPASSYSVLEETPVRGYDKWFEDSKVESLFTRLSILVAIYPASSKWEPARKAAWAFGIAQSLMLYPNTQDEPDERIRLYRADLDVILDSYASEPEQRIYVKDIKRFIDEWRSTCMGRT